MTIQSEDLRELFTQAERLIESRNFDEAETLLVDAGPAGVASQDEGRWHALLGLAYFHQERYDESAAQYRLATQANPDHTEWAHALMLSEANVAAQAQLAVPPVFYHERDVLLGPPEIPTLPVPPPPPKPTFFRDFRFIVGHGLGKLSGGVFTWATDTFGKRYRGEVWTNWYRKRLYLGILTLAYMREKLNKDNLLSPYPEGVNVAFQPDNLTVPTGAAHYRTADGSWNNLKNPKEGAAGTRFPRNVHSSVIKPANDEELLSPNPREVSRKLLTRDGDMKEVPFLNMLAAAWIQFQNHDWISHGENLSRELIEIPLAEDDPARQNFKQTNMFIGRTQPDPTRQEWGEPSAASFVNEVTHWWDGSQIYGSDQATQDRLRSGVGGKLRVTEDGTLPLDDRGVEETGFTRNWWVGLSMFHNLFVLEHNSICDELAKRYPDWNDGRLFNVARLINAAVMAKIHSIEWTPAILPNPGLHMGLNMNWYGGLTYTFVAPKDRKTVATYNVANPELGGLVGNDIDKHGAAFGLTEEFVEIYRLHSLLPEKLRLQTAGLGQAVDEVPFAATRQAGSAKVVQEHGMANLLYSFGNQNPGQLTLNNYPRFMQELSMPGNPLFDLGAVDILRARERGIPRYNEFRRQLGLNPIQHVSDLTDDADAIARITELYDDVEDIDLMVGTLAEGTRPTGFGFGETMFQIFILNASRRLQADRFYTDMYNADVYTQEGLDWVDAASLKSVLLRHYPELESTGLGNITNAFEPWDETEVLDPLRHPLRAYYRELKDDPWRGDAGKTPAVAPSPVANTGGTGGSVDPVASSGGMRAKVAGMLHLAQAAMHTLMPRKMLRAIGVFFKRLLARFWQQRDPAPTLEELKVLQYENTMNPADNIQQAMNLVIPLKDPSPVGRAKLVQMLAGHADEVVAGLHNTGIVHFARFTIVGDNLLMFSIFDGDFANYIRDFIYNIGSFFDDLMLHTIDGAPTPVEDNPDDFVDWVKRVDAWQLSEDITAVSDDLDDLGRQLTLTMDRVDNVQVFVYRASPNSTIADVRKNLKVGW